SRREPRARARRGVARRAVRASGLRTSSRRRAQAGRRGASRPGADRARSVSPPAPPAARRTGRLRSGAGWAPAECPARPWPRWPSVRAFAALAGGADQGMGAQAHYRASFQAMARQQEHAVVEATGREVRVSNPGKLFFPERGLTKLDLVSYYLECERAVVR